MLKNVPKLLSPELLKILCEMGHGDEIVLADANFPAEALAKRVIRADGIGGVALLSALLTVMPLDTYSERNFLLMELTESDKKKGNPPIWNAYEEVANSLDPNVRTGYLERFDFYERAKNAYAVIASGEEAVYANILLKKGVIQ